MASDSGGVALYVFAFGFWGLGSVVGFSSIQAGLEPGESKLRAYFNLGAVVHMSDLLIPANPKHNTLLQWLKAVCILLVFFGWVPAYFRAPEGSQDS